MLVSESHDFQTELQLEVVPKEDLWKRERAEGQVTDFSALRPLICVCAQGVVDEVVPRSSCGTWSLAKFVPSASSRRISRRWGKPPQMGKAKLSDGFQAGPSHVT